MKAGSYVRILTNETVRDEEVAICCDIDVRPDTDMEAVQAEVFYLIENYLNPSINFYLLKELMAKGKQVDEIFQGPRIRIMVLLIGRTRGNSIERCYSYI